MVAALAGFLLVVAFGVGNIWRWSGFSPEMRVSILDIVVLILTLAAGFRGVKKYSRITIPVFVFAAVAGVSLISSAASYSWSNVLVGAMYLLRWVIYALFFLSLVRLFKAHELGKVILSLGLVTTLVGLGQYLFYPDVRSLQVAEWDPHYYRVVGSWLDPGFTGLLLVFTMVYLLLNPLKSRLINFIAWSATYLVFALTYSRSSYLAFLAAMAWMAWKRKRGKFFVGMAALLLVTVVLLPRAPSGEGVKLERTNSIQARIDSWTTAARIFVQHPVLGVGFNVYRYAQGASLVSHAGAGADSSLLFVAATTGILGLAAYLGYLKRLFSLDPIPYYLIPLLVHSLFLNSLFYPAVMVWLSLLILYGSDSRLGQKQ